MRVSPNQSRAKSGFIIIWEFRVLPAKQRLFEKAYGRRGEWAKFFQQAKGYIGTELIRDLNERDRYFTLDFWRSRRAYDAFKSKHREMYRLIDEKCESLTTREIEIGQFSAVLSRS